MLLGVNKSEPAPGNSGIHQYIQQDEAEMEGYEDYKKWDTDLNPHSRFDRTDTFERSSEALHAVETVLNVLIPCVVILVVLIIILSVIIRLWKHNILTCCPYDPSLIDEDSLGICSSSDEDSFAIDEDAKLVIFIVTKAKRFIFKKFRRNLSN